MKPRIHTITLGVNDLEKSVTFYRDIIGWPTDGIIGAEFRDSAVAVFDMEQGSRLQLFLKTNLARESGIPIRSANAAEFSLGYYVASKEKFTGLIGQIRNKTGVMITKEPGATAWGGYNAYFQDLDGHLWEVVWDPKLMLGE